MSDLITEAMLPQFEPTAEVAARNRAWAALGSLEDGTLTSEEVTMLYGFTEAQLETYRPAWEALRVVAHG